MLALALCLLGFTGLSVACKLAQSRGSSLPGFNLVLFGACAAGSVTWATLAHGWGRFGPAFWAAGLASGPLALLATAAFLKALAAGPFSTGNAVMRSSVVIPAAAGMLIFGEQPCAIRLAGCAAVLASFAMAGANPRTKGNPAARGAGWLFWIIVCWGANGLAQVVQVWVAKAFPGGEICYLVAFYGSGTAVAAALAGFRRQWPCRADWTYGTLAAAGSLLGMVALMRALALLDASVAMPVSIAGAMALIMVAGRYFFGERLAVKDWAVVVLASAGSALLAAS